MDFGDSATLLSMEQATGDVASKQPLERRNDYEENLSSMIRAEKAALSIQRKFRENHPNVNPSDPAEEMDDYVVQEKDGTDSEDGEEEKDISKLYNLVLMALFSIGGMLHKILKNCRGSDETDGVEAAQNIPVDGNIPTSTPGGGGNGAAPQAQGLPPGVESMAAQAAGNAAGSAAAGASAGASVGTAAVGAMAAAGVGAQAMAAVAVTAAVATTVSTVALSPIPEPQQFLSTCGLVDPQFRDGSVRLSFQGFEREFNTREIGLLENLYVDSYNTVTRGGNLLERDNNTAAGCVDEFQREMLNATLIQQIFGEAGGSSKSSLDIVVDASIICEGCPSNVPLFGSSSNTTVENGLEPTTDGFEAVILDTGFMEAHLKELVIQMIQLVESGELPTSFVPSKVLVKPSPPGSVDGILLLPGGGIVGETLTTLVSVPIALNIDQETGEFSVLFPEPSVCAIADPDFYQGVFTISFEGFGRTFALEEATLVESLVLSTYNKIANGNGDPSADGTACSDPFLREMQKATLSNQTFQDANGEGQNSKIDVTFDALVLCNGCPPEAPLFGTGSFVLEGDGNLEAALDMTLIAANLKEIVLGIVDLINESLLPSSFVPTKVYVKPEEEPRQGEDLPPILVSVPIHFEVDGDGQIELEVPDPSTCGLTIPEFYKGVFRMTFEGFARVFQGVEVALLEEAAVEAYNQVTTGIEDATQVVATVYCADPYSREMQGATIIEQIFREASGEQDSTLDITFDAWVICQGCPEILPLFGVPTVDGRLLQAVNINLGAVLDSDLVYLFMEKVVEKIIQYVQEKTLDFTFVPTKVYVNSTLDKTTADTGSTIIDLPILIEVDDDGEVTVEFPGTSESPSVQPSAAPSSTPSETPSLQPSSTPSTAPSATPSSVPSESPSMAPSVVPSSIPSNVPSVAPSEVPSVNPSASPSGVPSRVPSSIPSYVPSVAPSDVPSMNPSASPSGVPSMVPSVVPSYVPSVAPSDVPSVNPSASPSSVPSMVPSQQPSAVPSIQPTTSLVPSRQPSSEPSQVPTRFGICDSASRFNGWAPTPVSLSPTPTEAVNGGTPFSGDDSLFTLNLPFTYPWLCRRSVTSLKISTNIVVYQGDEASTGFNTAFPSTYARIAVGDSDWIADLDGSSSRISYGIDTVNQRVSIKWDSVYRYGTDATTGPRVTFQVELYPEGGIKICHVSSTNYAGTFYSGVEDPLYDVMKPIYNPSTANVFPVGCWESVYIN